MVSKERSLHDNGKGRLLPLLPVTPPNPRIAQCLLAIPFASLKAVQARQVGKENGPNCRLPN